MENNKLTAEEVKAVEEVIKSTETEEDKLVASLPSNNGVEVSNGSEEATTEQKKVNINPNNGSLNVLTDRESEEDDEYVQISDDLKKLLTMEDDEVYAIPESLDEIEITEEMLKGKIKEGYDLSDNDIKVLLPLIQKYRVDRNSCKWFNEMPKKLQDLINKQCLEVNNNSSEAKNLFASEILDAIVRETKMDKIVIDMQKSIAEAYDLSPLMEMIIDKQKTSFEDAIDKKIEILTNKKEESTSEESKDILEEKIKMLEDIKNAFYQSYTYEDMIDKIKRGKIRVKPFDIRKYARFCSEFNYKYEGDTPFIIHDVRILMPVLKRKFSKYTEEQVCAFVIAFIKHTQNMNSKSPIDHTFMSYFISNIINLDMITDTKEKSVFSTTLMGNIEKGIRAINNIN